MIIGVVDDDLKFIETFEKELYPRLLAISNDNDNQLITSTIMLDSNVINTMDFVFFDIQLENENSIDLILNARANYDTKIIFLSSNNNLVFDSLRVKPLTFIRKSNLNEDFNLFLELFRDLLIKRKNILLNCQSRKELVLVNKIQYFIACGHDITIVTSEKKYNLISSLKKVLQELNDIRFIQIQKSVCINMDYIKEINDNMLIMTNGMVMEVSKYFKKGLRDSYLKYLLENDI